MYVKTSCSGLYFREKDERTKRRKLLPGYGMPKRSLARGKTKTEIISFTDAFNQGVVTINLVDVALSSGGDEDKFWKVFDERLDLCYRALMCRHNRLKGTLSDAAPILWQFGALARLKKRGED